MWRKVSFIKWLPLLGGLIAVLLLVAACGEDATATPAATPTATPVPKTVIKFHNPQWETIEEHNAIAAYIVEHGYGYPVEIVIGDTGTMQVALPLGELDVNMELWQANIPIWYADVTAKGTVVDLTGGKGPVANGATGQIIEATDQGWYVPSFVIEANPGLKSVSDLPNFIELFEDPEDPGKGVWLSCTPGAACTKRFIAKANAYGLDQTYNVQTPGSYGALAAAIEGADKARKPVLAYYWEPTKLLAELDMTQLEEPAWTQECADALAVATESEPYESASDATMLWTTSTPGSPPAWWIVPPRSLISWARCSLALFLWPTWPLGRVKMTKSGWTRRSSTSARTSPPGPRGCPPI